MTIYEIRHHAEEMGIPFREALFMRFRYVRAEMLRELEEVDTPHPDEITEAVMDTLAINRFIELAKEQRALFMAVKHNDTPGRITDEMVQQARQYPVTQLIDFQRGKSRAWCHDDRNPSLYLAPRVNRVVCPVCGKYFSSIDVLIERDGLSFPEAVRMLAA